MLYGACAVCLFHAQLTCIAHCFPLASAHALPRVLLNAASRGLADVAEDTIEQMRESGLPPGPRAYHALVFSYVRANLPYDALDTAARAADDGELIAGPMGAGQTHAA